MESTITRIDYAPLSDDSGYDFPFAEFSDSFKFAVAQVRKRKNFFSFIRVNTDS